jgi:hypothetical protein
MCAPSVRRRAKRTPAVVRLTGAERLRRLASMGGVLSTASVQATRRAIRASAGESIET